MENIDQSHKKIEKKTKFIIKNLIRGSTTFFFSFNLIKSWRNIFLKSKIASRYIDFDIFFALKPFLTYDDNRTVQESEISRKLLYRYNNAIRYRPTTKGSFLRIFITMLFLA